MKYDDDPDLKRIQALIDEKGGALRSEELPERPARKRTLADTYGGAQSPAGRFEQVSKQIVEQARQAHRDFPLRIAREQFQIEQELQRLRVDAMHAAPPVPPAPNVKTKASPGRFAARLKKLKTESNLTWVTIARESGISRRRLLEISAGADPSRETAKSIREYFTRILKRRIQL
jgi:hypothetical protein